MRAYINFMDKAVLAMIVLCAVLLPWNFLVPQVATFIAFFWLIGFNWTEKWKNMKSSPLVWIWVSFYALYIAGCFWSSNKEEAVIILLVKLGIFIFPLVFSSLRFDEKKSRLIFGMFLTGLFTVGLFMLIRSFVLYSTTGVSKFSYQDFSDHIMHPSYLSLYFVVGVMLLFHGVLLQKESAKRKIIASILALFFCVIVFMLASKTGMISLVITFLFYIGYAIFRFKRYVVAVSAIVILVGGFFIAIHAFPVLGSRLEVMTQVMSSSAPIDPKDTESNRVRLLIWQADLELIAEHPLLGFGTGDVHDQLMRKYAERGMTGAVEKRLNAHCQFFQTGIALGIVGVTLLSTIFLSSFVWGIRNRFGFVALFTMLIVFNCIPESMLQVQAGTLFVGFFYSLFLFAADRQVLSPPSGGKLSLNQKSV